MATIEFEDEEGGSKEDKILSTALKRFQKCEESMVDIRREMLDDLNFVAGNHWNEIIKKDRTSPGQERPCLVIDRVTPVVNQIVNDYKRNRTMMKVRPANDDATEVTAKIIDGMVRHIQYNADSTNAIDMALESCVRCSLGFFQIRNDYDAEDSMNQVILMDRVENPFTVYFPIHLCKQPDFSDAPYCFITDDVPTEDFKEENPGVDLSSWKGSGIGDGNNKWLNQDFVRVAEYFVREETKAKLYMLSDGTVVENKEQIPEGLTIVKERETTKSKVMWYKLCMSKILDSKELPSKWIPVIPVIGGEINIEGKKHYISAIRFAKDPQRMLNYLKSCQAERIALSPLAPWIAAEGQVEDNHDIWEASNRKNIGVLTYKPVTLAGVLVGQPSRVAPPDISSGITEALRETVDDIKATTGIYDASLGARSNETSGRAIIARQKEGDNANYHFVDNLNRAMRHACRIIVDMLPKIYDTARIVRILGNDMNESVAMVNAHYHNGKNPNPNGEIYDLSVGRYDVIVDTGPSYQTQKLETSDLLISICQGNPNLAAQTADLQAKLAGAPQDIIDRFRKLLPPGLVEQDNNQKGVPPAQVQQMAQEYEAKIADLQKLLEQAMEDVEKLEKQVADKQAGIRAHLLETRIKSDTDIEKAHIANSHGYAMENYRNAIENNPALAEIINDLSLRLAQIENTVKVNTAPARPAETQVGGVPNVNANA